MRESKKGALHVPVMHVVYSGFSVSRGDVHDVNDVQVMCVHYKRFCAFVL